MTEDVDVPENPKESAEKLTVLFLSSDTGGGHRASAEALANQFQLQFPGTEYHLLDVMKDHGTLPYNSLTSSYKHLSAHPAQWKAVYSISNTKAFEILADVHLKVMCERAFRQAIKSYNPDVVVSVHPLMTNVPVLSCQKISQETGKNLPIFTVVTDLGSAHCLWFCNGVEKMFIGSEEIRALAKERGKVPDNKLIMCGLPIRHDFAVQAELLGDRTSKSGKDYQTEMRTNLGIAELDYKVVLLMGGGEGVGSLSNIVDALYVDFTNRGINAVILVVCGRNDKLKQELETKNWDDVIIRGKEILSGSSTSCWGGVSTGRQLASAVGAGCLDSNMTTQIRKILSSSSLSMDVLSTKIHRHQLNGFTTGQKDATAAQDIDVGTTPQSEEETLDQEKEPETVPEVVPDTVIQGDVKVMGLGFVTNMAEYMVAADVLVTKAGPGTIAEAASVGLPVMLTSFLPGQEEGNVDFVVNGNFGQFIPDVDPPSIAEAVSNWLKNDAILTVLSKAATSKGCPNAAADIARQIGESAIRWKKINMSIESKKNDETSSDSVDLNERE